ncbi:hypothetical protein PENANT_c002G10523 [Penicillium antarcticum]|uniref:Uncharacterized protein n=1 Tax=Penicillium antarcticum TaxID=416450 RepID=A0A1V6QL94_9EURO|nr:hypothetical protein PENANT_c002G10523 [Penicillium antarcticum]
MFEDINRSGDGGLYGQSLQNPGLQGKTPRFDDLGTVGDATIAVDSNDPLSSAVPHSLRLHVPVDTSGPVCVTNSGYWVIPVDEKYFRPAFGSKDH